MTGAMVVTGGAGLIGSHLCERLVADGHDVVAVDNLSTGSRANLDGLADHPRFRLVEADVTAGVPVDGPVGGVFHFASPASPPDYLRLPIETLMVGSEGTHHALRLARAHRARFVLASTSEVYGDPLEHPQTEAYWGNVNPVGPRSVYDEAKRFAEALTMAYARAEGVDVGIARIFNTYGPRMRVDDGRVVSNFVVQALRGAPLTTFGDGTQTRSFCYVDDLVDGVVALHRSGASGPINLGNPVECTILELAELVIDLTGSPSGIGFCPLPVDDPVQRQPDITAATAELDWVPRVALRDGLARTIDFFRAAVGVAAD